MRACVRACVHAYVRAWTCVHKNKSKREIVTLKMVISILSLNFTFLFLLPVFQIQFVTIFFTRLAFVPVFDCSLTPNESKRKRLPLINIRHDFLKTCKKTSPEEKSFSSKASEETERLDAKSQNVGQRKN